MSEILAIGVAAVALAVALLAYIAPRTKTKKDDAILDFLQNTVLPRLPKGK